MMNRIIASICFVALLSGCTQSLEKNHQFGQIAVASLNKQIEDFNANRMIPNPNMGISSIERRVSRVEYDSKLNQLNTFDQDGKPFMVLKREPDGGFKGVLEQPYHQLVGSGPDGSHSWGKVMAEFHLEKGMF